jgi:hypothetical protein
LPDDFVPGTSRSGPDGGVCPSAVRPCSPRSKLPHHKTLEDYDFSFQPDLDPRKVKDLATLSFVEDRANVALLGPPGGR